MNSLSPNSTLHSAGPVLTLSPGNYAFLQKYIYAESGIVIDHDKQYLLESRLLPILREQKLPSMDSLSELLAARPSHPIARLVVEAMTTNETLFFRDLALFDAMRHTILPQLFASIKTSRRLRILSAAASSGQEAYSIAMLLQEMGWNKAGVEIVGVDLSNQVLERARKGRYVQFEVNRGLSPSMLGKYFTPMGTEWQLKDQIRDMVRFEQLDLRRDLRGLGMFDLVLCRNVLIYFDAATKKKILYSIANILEPGGALVLGCAETILNIHPGLKRCAAGQSTFYMLS